MNIPKMMEDQKRSLSEVDWSQASFKAGVLLRLTYETLKPIVVWTALFFVIGALSIVGLFIKVLFGGR